MRFRITHSSQFSSLNRDGFTLIEIMLVMAISGSLAVIALAGQQQLRARSQFDAAIDQMIATVNDAHNKATSGVNTSGSLGNGMTACPGGLAATNTFPYQQYEFAGVAWVPPAAGSNVVIEQYYEALPGAVACAFQTKTATLPVAVTTNLPAPAGGRMLFIRNNDGSLRTCAVSDLTTNVAPFFSGGACSNTSLILQMTDSNGHTARILIDQSGLATRN